MIISFFSNPETESYSYCPFEMYVIKALALLFLRCEMQGLNKSLTNISFRARMLTEDLPCCVGQVKLVWEADIEAHETIEASRSKIPQRAMLISTHGSQLRLQPQ